MPQSKVNAAMNDRAYELVSTLVKRATSQSALAKALDYSPTQIGHLLHGRRRLTHGTQQQIANYLGIPQDKVEMYYLTGNPSLEELLTIPKLTGRVDLQVAIACLHEAPAITKIEQGLQLLQMGLKKFFNQ